MGGIGLRDFNSDATVLGEFDGIAGEIQRGGWLIFDFLDRRAGNQPVASCFAEPFRKDYGRSEAAKAATSIISSIRNAATTGSIG